MRAAFRTDDVQAKVDGYAGPYVRAQHRANKEKNREELRKISGIITAGGKR
jgi:hypothetical protein